MLARGAERETAAPGKSGAETQADQAARAAQVAYVTAVDEWRAFLRLPHAAFCRRLGCDPAAWSRIRRYGRPPTELFHARVMTRATGPWRTGLRDDWRRLQEAEHRSIRARLEAIVAAPSPPTAPE